MTTATPPSHMKVNALPRSLYPAQITYSPSDLKRQDESSDTAWYSQPRFVHHIDGGAISALKAYYSSILKADDSVLEICSSWTSHLPDGFKLKSMIGYGMNTEELQRNAHLTSFFVKDLNTHPSLDEVPSSSIDVMICNLSMDYLNKPVKVFDELRRVLKGGGTAHMAFSNRCFPTKVIGIWMQMDDAERRRWIGGYFWASGGWEDVEEVVLKEAVSEGLWGGHEDPLFVVRGKKTKEDQS